eukprot:766011-Hanusia_phi.AAC.2
MRGNGSIPEVSKRGGGVAWRKLVASLGRKILWSDGGERLLLLSASRFPALPALVGTAMSLRCDERRREDLSPGRSSPDVSCCRHLNLHHRSQRVRVRGGKGGRSSCQACRLTSLQHEKLRACVTA